MPDFEKVIKGLEHCPVETKCEGCPYRAKGEGCFDGIMRDAWELLQEQKQKIESQEHQLASLTAKQVLDNDRPQIVRCKDCMHGKQILITGYNGKEYEKRYCDKFQHTHESEWFCADGERREKTMKKEYDPFTRYLVAVSIIVGKPSTNYHEFDDFDEAKEFAEKTIKHHSVMDVCIYEHKSY